eukprot:1681314-Pleurochrysis_carterae.AAC.5
MVSNLSYFPPDDWTANNMVYILLGIRGCVARSALIFRARAVVPGRVRQRRTGRGGLGNARRVPEHPSCLAAASLRILKLQIPTPNTIAAASPFREENH